MTKNPGVPTEVLHSEEHSKLSAEEIAKAVARQRRITQRKSRECSSKGEESRQLMRLEGSSRLVMLVD